MSAYRSSFNKALFEDTAIQYDPSRESIAVKMGGLDVYSIRCIWDTDAAPAAKTWDSGTSHVFTATFPAKAGATGGDYVLLPGLDNIEFYAVSLDKTGSDPEPTGAYWVSVPASNKVHVDISACTDAASVAAAVEAAFNVLVGAEFTADDTAADGTVTFTNSNRAPLSDGIVKNADDSGAGSITLTSSTPGVFSSLNLTTGNIVIDTHGLSTGMAVQLTTTGTLPTGLSLSTTYYIIKVDANNIKLASSYDNAIAGTAIIPSNDGTESATHTATPTALSGSIQLQVTNDDPESASARWVNYGSATSISGDSSATLYGPTGTSLPVVFAHRGLKMVVSSTGGGIKLSAVLNARSIG